jgi:hypothetical protein
MVIHDDAAVDLKAGASGNAGVGFDSSRDDHQFRVESISVGEPNSFHAPVT